MRIVRNRADVGGLILLAIIAIAGAILTLAGHEVGLFILLAMAGIGFGTALVYFPTRSRRAQKPVAGLALFGVLVFLLIPFVGLWLGVGWLVYPSMASGSPSGGFLFGLAVGAGQVALGRLIGRGPWAGG